ncbi:unnamed protein product [Caenorhabditis auriculariae]|uniref:Carboxylesterase type B domain-containing protein n=1 Tax=Caenorhabditis auriculariae TaxID=2777116 RepID=A0A8S1GX84_9PELO|nr:unnamed protein product [Caenorhabditis auriculariae]
MPDDSLPCPPNYADPSGEYPPSRVVNTKYGPIEGRRLIHQGPRQVDAFQGIPYAATPTGELRFKLPQPPKSWSEVLSTKNFGFRGIQKDKSTKYSIKTSEDNLTLNVFTPVWAAPEKEGFAVLVYIHGGGYVSDSAVKYGDLRLSQRLVTKDVVVVTVQYRLGFLGFWTSGDDACPDNIALHDMTFALKWVQENILEFNGNPNNVTVMGQSAGGASVDLLSLSPVSRDLFHKVIPMAGNANCYWAISSNTLSSCRNLARSIEIHDEQDSEQWIEKLRKVNAETFARGIGDKIDTNKTPCSIGPIYDNVFLPKSVQELRQEAPAKPCITGCARSEGFIAMKNEGTVLERINNVLSDLVPQKEFPRRFREIQKDILKRLIDVDQEHTEEEWMKVYVELLGDAFMNVGVQEHVLQRVETYDAPVYFYSFDYANPDSYGPLAPFMPFLDASHCFDIGYLFGVGIIFNFLFNDEDERVFEIMTKLFSNFVKYGNPNGGPNCSEKALGDVEWLPATKENPQIHLSIGPQPRLKQKYKDGRPMAYVDMRRETP